MGDRGIGSNDFFGILPDHKHRPRGVVCHGVTRVGSFFFESSFFGSSFLDFFFFAASANKIHSDKSIATSRSLGNPRRRAAIVNMAERDVSLP